MNGNNLCLSLALAGVLVTPTFAVDRAAWQSNWPQWRGPLGSGVAPSATPPLEWSETQNVKWKVDVPGEGHSTPIIWENKVFLLTSIPTGKTVERDQAAEEAGGGRRRTPPPTEVHQFAVVCLDRSDGRLLWQQVAREELPHEGHHGDATFASASPVTDGEHLIASFGSRGTYCYDLDGNLKWEKDLGDMTVRGTFGEGSSPALHGDTVVILWDHEGDDDFLVALDKATGSERWRVQREEGTAWTTPVIAEVDGAAQVIIAGTGAIRSYALDNGKEVWMGPGLTMNVIPTPIVDDGVLYAMSGFRGNALHAIRLGGTGDLTSSDAILWSYDRDTPYVPSGILAGDYLYFVSGNSGMLTCLDAKTGSPYFSEERLEGIRGMYASPVTASERVYILGRDGTCVVLEQGPELKVLATNKLNTETDASMAMVDDELFIRGHQHLYCIE